MKVNDIMSITIEDYGYNGEGIARIDGFVIFVPYSRVNETVQIKFTNVYKNYAIAERLDLPVAKCPYFGICGGCDIMHLAYIDQLTYKSRKVADNLKHIANIDFNVNQTIASPNVLHYRNKITLSVKKNKIGLMKNKTNEIVEIDNCLIFSLEISKIIEIFKNYLTLNSIFSVKNIVIKSIDDKLCIIIVSNAIVLKNINSLIESLTSLNNKINLYLCINKKNKKEVLTNNIKLLHGNKTIMARLGDIKFEVSPQSFLQVNNEVQSLLYNYVINLIPKNKIVLNLYSGAGLLSALFAVKSKEVIGIEIDDSATRSANTLAINNYISNMKNITGDVKDKIMEITKPDIVVLDPPRRGVNEDVLNRLRILAPNKIIYISCDSATLSRDLKTLIYYYDIISVQPFDMFPQTKDVETVVELQKKFL